MVELTDQEREVARGLGITDEQYQSGKSPALSEDEKKTLEFDSMLKVVNHSQHAPGDKLALRKSYRGKNELLDEWMDANPLPESEDNNE